WLGGSFHQVVAVIAVGNVSLGAAREVKFVHRVMPNEFPGNARRAILGFYPVSGNNQEGMIKSSAVILQAVLSRAAPQNQAVLSHVAKARNIWHHVNPFDRLRPAVYSAQHIALAAAVVALLGAIEHGVFDFPDTAGSASASASDSSATRRGSDFPEVNDSIIGGYGWVGGCRDVGHCTALALKIQTVDVERSVRAGIDEASCISDVWSRTESLRGGRDVNPGRRCRLGERLNVGRVGGIDYGEGLRAQQP